MHCKTVDINIPYQKGVDVSLVTAMMGLGFEDVYDIAVIISGDDDFVDAVNHIKSKGKKVWVASFSASLGQDLMRAADRVILLDRLFDDITIPK